MDLWCRGEAPFRNLSSSTVSPFELDGDWTPLDGDLERAFWAWRIRLRRARRTCTARQESVGVSFFENNARQVPHRTSSDRNSAPLAPPNQTSPLTAPHRTSSHLISPSPHLTLPHLTRPHPSPHLTSPHRTSPHLTSPHRTSPHLISPSPHLTLPHLTRPHPSPHLPSPHLT